MESVDVWLVEDKGMVKIEAAEKDEMVLQAKESPECRLGIS